MREFTNPENSPITGKGSTTSHAGASRAIHFAGALFGDGIGDTAQASRYSSSGDSAMTTGALDGPSHAARADESTNLPGVPTSGVLTGSRMRLSGTSAAAPIVLRKIINGKTNWTHAPSTKTERIGQH